MKYAGTSLTLLACVLLVVITACGGREPQTVVVNPPAANPDVVKRESVTTREIIRDNTALPRETVREVMVPQPPPPPREEVIPPPPSSSQVWVPGRWVWDNGWQWQSGHFEQPPERMATWIPGQWIQQGPNWVWQPGRWQ